MNKIITYGLLFFSYITLNNAIAQTKNIDPDKPQGRDTTLTGRIGIIIQDNFKEGKSKRFYTLCTNDSGAYHTYNLIFNNKRGSYGGFFKPNDVITVRGKLTDIPSPHPVDVYVEKIMK